MKFVRAGGTLVVDQESLVFLRGLPISSSKRKHTAYAIAGYVDRATGRKRNCYVHHLIVGYPLNGLVVDHGDRNGLNNRRSNLAVVTPAKNMQNTVRSNASTYRGVIKHGHRFHSRFRGHIVSFPEAIEAARCYDAVVVAIHGLTARINFTIKEAVAWGKAHPEKMAAMGVVIRQPNAEAAA